MNDVAIIITVPRKFHDVLQLVARAFDESVEEYVLDQIISGLDGDLQDYDSRPGLWSAAGFERDCGYEPQLRALAAGGAD